MGHTGCSSNNDDDDEDNDTTSVGHAKSKCSSPTPNSQLPIQTLSEDPSWMRRAKELFALCDADGGGDITLDEMHNVHEQLGLALDAEQLQAVFNALDADGNGRLSLDEFLAGFGVHTAPHF